MHFRNECQHGVIVSQCRCPGPVTPNIVACPQSCDASPSVAATPDDFVPMSTRLATWAEGRPIPFGEHDVIREAIKVIGQVEQEESIAGD